MVFGESKSWPYRKNTNNYTNDCLARVGSTHIRSMMGGYLGFLKNKLVGDIGDSMLLLGFVIVSPQMFATVVLLIVIYKVMQLLHITNSLLGNRNQDKNGLRALGVAS